MTITTRVKRTGRPWIRHPISVTRSTRSRRKRLVLRIGPTLTLELTAKQAFELTNLIVDTLEH